MFENQIQGTAIDEHCDSHKRTTKDKIDIQRYYVITYTGFVAPNEIISIVVKITARDEKRYSMEKADSYDGNKDKFHVCVREPSSVGDRTSNGKKPVDGFGYLDIKSSIIEYYYQLSQF